MKLTLIVQLIYPDVFKIAFQTVTGPESAYGSDDRGLPGLCRAAVLRPEARGQRELPDPLPGVTQDGLAAPAATHGTCDIESSREAHRALVCCEATPSALHPPNP